MNIRLPAHVPNKGNCASTLKTCVEGLEILDKIFDNNSNLFEIVCLSCTIWSFVTFSNIHKSIQINIASDLNQAHFQFPYNDFSFFKPMGNT